jgi:hypothetical protein
VGPLSLPSTSTTLLLLSTFRGSGLPLWKIAPRGHFPDFLPALGGGPFGGPGQKPVEEEGEAGEAQLEDQLHHPGGPADQPPPLLDFPLTHFSGAYSGNGFSLIWAPRKFDGPGPTPTADGRDDSTLILQLTTEQWTFGPTLGNIPNRGFGTQEVINLGGQAYIQTVQNVTNDETGKGDKPKTTAGSGIHSEPGMFLYVPKVNFQDTDTIVRMASIPHGTTMNAQGPVPAKTANSLGGATGAPTIEDVDTTPFPINNPGNRLVERFAAPMTADRDNLTLRVPQKLKPFDGEKTITTDIIKDPNEVLRNALQGLTVKEHVAFEVSTGHPTAKINSGGISHIAFLSGKQDPVEDAAKPAAVVQPNAHAESATSKFWIEKIEYDVIGPKMPGYASMDLKPEMPPSPHQAPTPRFRITAPRGRVPPGGKRIKVIGTQIQHTQTILLNFGRLGWPHVTCATLVPTDLQRFQMTGKE